MAPQTLDDFFAAELQDTEKSASRTSSEANIDAFVNDLKSGTDSFNKNKRPKAGFGERVMANALFTGQEPQRKAYLNAMGKDANEPGWFYDQPGVMPKLKELGTDIAETMVGPGIKAVLQTVGENVARAISLGNPLATATGGALGRGESQRAFEGIAKAIDMAPGGADQRVIAEYMNGLMGSAIAGAAPFVPGALVSGTKYGKQLLGKAKELVTKIPGVGPSIKTGTEAMTNFIRTIPTSLRERTLQEISKIPKEVRDVVASIPKGWNSMVLLTKNAQEYAADLAKNRIVPGLNRYKQIIGQKFEAATGHILDNPENTINFDPLKPRIKEVIKPFFRKLDDADVASINTVLDGFFTTPMNPALKKVGIKAGNILPQNATMTLGQAYKKMALLDDMLQSKWAQPGTASKSQDAITAMFKGIRRELKDYIHQKYGAIKSADELFERGHDIWETGLKNFGENQRAVDFARTSLLLKKPTSDEIFARRAFDVIDDVVPEKFGNAARLYSAAEFLKQTTSKEASGFQYSLLPRMLGGGAGAVWGAASDSENRFRGAAKGAAIGAGSVYAAQYPFLNPARATKTMSNFTKLNDMGIPQKVGEAASKGLVGLLKWLPKTPAGSAIIDMQDRMGIQVTEDDLKILKARNK